MIAAKRKNKKGMKSNKFQWLCFFFLFLAKPFFGFAENSFSISYDLMLSLPQRLSQFATTSFSIYHNLALNFLQPRSQSPPRPSCQPINQSFYEKKNKKNKLRVYIVLCRWEKDTTPKDDVGQTITVDVSSVKPSSEQISQLD